MGGLRFRVGAQTSLPTPITVDVRRAHVALRGRHVAVTLGVSAQRAASLRTTGRHVPVTLSVSAGQRSQLRVSGRSVTTEVTNNAALTALSFPRNSAQTENAPYILQLKGANVFTPGYPATYIWQYRPRSPNNGGGRSGYYTTFFYGDSRLNQGFDPGNGYYGAHPYPNPAPNGANANWEVSADGQDIVVDLNGNSTVLVPDVWYTQALTVHQVGSEIQLNFYWNLGVGTDRLIRYTTQFSTANTFPPPSPGISFGDACWSVSQERMNGFLGAVKIHNTRLALADIVSEAASMGSLVTAAGISSRHWFKPTYASVDDLTDSVTGKVAAWANASFKATLVNASTLAPV